MQLGASVGVEEAIDAVRRGKRVAEIESVTLDFKRTKASFEDTAHDLAEAVASQAFLATGFLAASAMAAGARTMATPTSAARA